MNALEIIGLSGLVPVCVIQDAADAVPTAKALLQGEIGVMEITMRTEAGIDSIRNVAQQCPDMLVGAGTVLTLDKCKESVEAGARFIVSPGFNEKIVDWCVKHQIPITPGCVTPTEIEGALAYGIRTVKFFPANIYGGIKACKALYGPYQSAGVSFIPTGGIDQSNLREYVDQPYIHAVGGGWLCNTKDVVNHRFDAIGQTAGEAVDLLLGFTVESCTLAEKEAGAIDAFKQKVSQIFHLSVEEDQIAGSVIHEPGQSEQGQLVIRTHQINRALYYLHKRGLITQDTFAKIHPCRDKSCLLADHVIDKTTIKLIQPAQL